MTTGQGLRPNDPSAPASTYVVAGRQSVGGAECAVRGSPDPALSADRRSPIAAATSGGGDLRSDVSAESGDLRRTGRNDVGPGGCNSLNCPDTEVQSSHDATLCKSINGSTSRCLRFRLTKLHATAIHLCNPRYPRFNLTGTFLPRISRITRIQGLHFCWRLFGGEAFRKPRVVQLIAVWRRRPGIFGILNQFNLAAAQVTQTIFIDRFTQKDESNCAVTRCTMHRQRIS